MIIKKQIYIYKKVQRTVQWENETLLEVCKMRSISEFKEAVLKERSIEQKCAKYITQTVHVTSAVICLGIESRL